MEADELVGAQVQELRRGTVVLACLHLLAEPSYGYALLERLNEAGVPVEGNTLYPLLRRLEKQGLLTSAWNTDESRPRKYYRTSAAGSQAGAELNREWQDVVSAMARLTGENS